MNLEQRIKEETARLLADRDGNILKQLYRDYCINTGLGEDFAERVLKEISISILPVNTPTHDAHPYYNIENKQERRGRNDKGIKKQSRKRRYYKFNGVECISNRDLAFAIAKQFIKDNPRLTYDDIRKNLPECARLITLADYKIREKETSDPDLDTRWLLKPEQLLCSSDSVYFAINGGWSHYGYGNMAKDNICSLIDFARKQGYVVEEL